MSWYMVDDFDGGIVLFGGDHPDPDSWFDMERAKPPVTDASD